MSEEKKEEKVLVGAELILTAKASESTHEEVVVDNVSIEIHNKKRNADGKSETSADHLGVNFTLGGKSFYRTVFQKNCALPIGHYAKVRIKVAATNDEYKFKVSSVVKDPNLMTMPEIASCGIVSLSF